MERTASFLRRHGWALLFAFLVAVLIELPVFLFPFWAGDRYEGVDMGYINTDQHYYLARAHEVLEGNGLGSSVVSGDKSQQDASFNSIELALMVPVRVFHLDRFFSVPTIYNFYNTLIVFGIVIGIYALLLALSEDALVSVTGAVSLVAGLTALIARSPFSGALHLYNRMPYPCTEVLVFLFFAFFLYRAITKERWFASATLAAILTGFSCYLSPYSWTFSFAFGGVLFIALLFAREFREAKRVFAIGVAGFVLGLPPLASFFLFKISSEWAQQAYFYSATISRAPFIASIGILAAALFLFYTYLHGREENRTRLAFIATLIGAGVLITNQQVILGWTSSNEHYYRYFLLPTAVIACTYLVFKLLPVRWKLPVSAAAIACTLLSLGVNQYLAFQTALPSAIREQQYAAVVPLLNSYPHGAVLTALDENAFPEPMLVTVLTNDDILWSKTALFQTIAFQHIEDTFLFYLFLTKDARHDPTDYLARSVLTGPMTPLQYSFRTIEGVRSGLSFNEYEAAFEARGPALLKARTAFFKELSARYQALFPNDAAARAWLKSQGVGYILWDKGRSPDWDISFLEPYALIGEQNGLSLFQLR